MMPSTLSTWARERSGHVLSRRSQQRGVILIIALIFMAVLALIVLASMRTGILQERMASNARNRQLALQAAEAVSRDAEVNVVRAASAPFDPFVPYGFNSACTKGICGRPGPGSNFLWKTNIDWASNASPLKTATFAAASSNIASGLVPSQPRYMVELMNTPVISPSAGGGFCPTIVSRVTAQGVGQDSAEVFVQTMYRTRPQFC